MPHFTKLNAANYPTWAGEMQAYLRSQGVWRIVSGDSKAPKLSSTPTEAQEAALDAWNLKLDKAAGYIFLAVEDNQKVHFASISDDPVKMWAALAAVHLQKRPGARFNAYDDLFSIRKQEDESLQSLMNRVDTVFFFFFFIFFFFLNPGLARPFITRCSNTTRGLHYWLQACCTRLKSP